MVGDDFGRALRRTRRRQGLSLRSLQALVRYDFTYLGQVERGEKPGSLALAVTCDEVLGADGRLLALFRAGSPSESDRPQPAVTEPIRTVPAARRQADSDSQSWDVFIGAGEAGEGRADVSEMDTLRALYHGTYSVDHLSRAVRACLVANSRRLASASPAERRRLLRVRGDAAMLAGRLALFDRWLPVAARGYLTMACDAAVEAGDDALAAGAYGHLAFVPARERLNGASAGYLDAARRHADRSGTAPLQSWVAAVEAEALAPVRPGDGLRALDRAVETLQQAGSQPTPPWFDFYSAARLDGFRGQVLLASGQGAAAREALARALASLEPDAVKQRAVLLADVAATHLCDRNPDVDEVAAGAVRAANELGRTGYRAAADRLVALRERLEPWSGSRAVRTLDEVLAAPVA